MASNPNYNDMTPEIVALSEIALHNSQIDPDDYVKYDVKRGLRDLNGKGVLAGLTEVSEIVAKKVVDGKEIPCDGKLYYRGIDVEELVAGTLADKRFGFEESVYLLLFGRLPDAEELEKFQDMLAYYRTLPTNFVRDIILKAPGRDLMNSLARSVLNLAAYDDRADDISLANVTRQCLQLIAVFPLLSVYGYQAYNYKEGNSLYIHAPRSDLSTAENILALLRPDSSYSFWEAHVLDICLMLHAEHGGGNNSTFTTHVVTSSGTDTYSCMAAALASLKGPKHGGANIKVVQMFEDMKKTVKDWNDEDEVRAYLRALLDKKAFDKAGLIYGMGHAVYSLSDPRANVFRGFVERLSREKGRMEEYQLYSLVERLGPEVISGDRKIYKGVSANVDFYSGFVYHMLDLPLELYTPIFAIARVAGWSAHRIEELINMGKIIRPAYQYVGRRQPYVPSPQRREKKQQTGPPLGGDPRLHFRRESGRRRSVRQILLDQRLEQLIPIQLADESPGIVVVGDIGGVLRKDVPDDLIDGIIALLPQGVVNGSQNVLDLLVLIIIETELPGIVDFQVRYTSCPAASILPENPNSVKGQSLI